MTELEKVIDDLGRVMACGQTMLDCGTESPMVFKMIRDAADNAIVFLKAQEPRLVTESDFNGADKYGYIAVWTEEKDGDMYWECIPKIVITDPDGIGVFRYWTSRPSDEVRRAIPWNAQK